MKQTVPSVKRKQPVVGDMINWNGIYININTTKHFLQVRRKSEEEQKKGISAAMSAPMHEMWPYA